MNKKEIFIGLILALLVALVLSPFASLKPDGLERVAADKSFLEKGTRVSLFKAPIADYLFPGVKNERLATALAGITGTIIVFALGYGIAYLVKRKP